MYNQQPFNPYRQNTEILRSFFAKPITLVAAIALAVASVASFNLVSILTCISLFLLYFKSRKANSDISFKAPTTILMVISIIYIVSCAISLFTSFFGLFSLGLMNSVSTAVDFPFDDFSSFFTTTYAIALPTLIAGLLFAIALLMFSSALKKSTTTVFLTNKGGAFLGIMSFILAVATICAAVITFLFLPDAFNDYMNAIMSYANSMGNVGSTAFPTEFFDIFNNMLSSIGVIAIVSSAFSAIAYIIFGIFALQFNSYIKDYTTSVNDGSVPRPAQPEFHQPQPTVNNNPSNYNAFEPQNVIFDEPENPYAHMSNRYQTPPQAPVCPNCGNQCVPNAQFCGKCGMKLK